MKELLQLVELGHSFKLDFYRLSLMFNTWQVAYIDRQLPDIVLISYSRHYASLEGCVRGEIQRLKELNYVRK